MCQCHGSSDGGSLAAFTYILQTLQRIEEHMGNFEDFAAAVSAKADANAAVLASLAADVAVLASGELTAEQQAAADAALGKLDALAASLTAVQTEVGDRDGDGVPAAPAADAPADEPAPADEAPAADAPAAPVE